MHHEESKSQPGKCIYPLSNLKQGLLVMKFDKKGEYKRYFDPVSIVI